jgi:hypothetical protein
MGAVIAYDKPVADFIDQLSATEHVTHTAYRKTSVTFHHNGGRLSHQGVLDVWKTRPASAHLDVDGQGGVAQYVKLNEYAWATGNTEGNKSSVSIELANATLAPDWLVAEATWREGARLCGWIHARVFGFRPSRDSVKIHSDWKATLCAGPHIRSILDTLVAEAQAAYDFFVGGNSAPAPSPVPVGQSDLTSVARAVIAGKWGNGPERSRRLQAAGYNPTEVQNEVNRLMGGGGGSAPPPDRKSVDVIAGEVLAGAWGNGAERTRRLTAAGYNATEVQNAVNARMGGNVAHLPSRPSNGVIAEQVIKGQWGNGAERTRRLTAAGFDAAAIQAEVNRRL